MGCVRDRESFGQIDASPESGHLDVESVAFAQLEYGPHIVTTSQHQKPWGGVDTIDKDTRFVRANRKLDHIGLALFDELRCRLLDHFDQPFGDGRIRLGDDAVLIECFGAKRNVLRLAIDDGNDADWVATFIAVEERLVCV